VAKKAKLSLFTASGATRGEMIQVTETADPGQLIHLAPPAEKFESAAISGDIDTGLDVITISAVNNDSADRTVHIQWSSGGAANRISTTLPVGAGLVDVVKAKRIARDLGIYAWASAGSVVNLIVQREPYRVAP
jgi:hypothetical protein